MKIETADVNDVGAEVRLHIMPGGRMLCSVAGVDLKPTPAWLCRKVAIQAALEALQQHAVSVSTCAGGSCSVPSPECADEDRLCLEGMRMLHAGAPVVLNLPYRLLCSLEEGSS